MLIFVMAQKERDASLASIFIDIENRKVKMTQSTALPATFPIPACRLCTH